MALVVAAALIQDGHLLVAQRAYPPELAGLWEFPGGKVEDGEDPVTALRREIEEELGIAITVGTQVPGPEGGDWPVHAGHRMRVFVATPLARPELSSDHMNLRWVPLSQSADVDWIPADRPILEQLNAALKAGQM
ncbi:MAG: (deoxy)nucleoside triphosphate pyrophosphohydrolase [Bowdeniella nasicola]|nr:(deoxy)nucleoside triphosphate pyrophosphohydrolase [Bowdeniella nasicola]